MTSDADEKDSDKTKNEYIKEDDSRGEVTTNDLLHGENADVVIDEEDVPNHNKDNDNDNEGKAPDLTPIDILSQSIDGFEVMDYEVM